MPEILPGTLEAIGLYLLRTSAMVLSAPVFSMGTGFTGARIALIAILSAVLYAATGSPVEGAGEPLLFGAMAVRELLVGFAIGFTVQLATLAVRVAGQLVGHEMGFAIAGQIDPETGVQVPLITSIWESLFLVGLLTVNGHHWLVRALADSFRAAPVGELRTDGGLAGAVTDLFASMFRAGITFAAPIMVLLALVSILIGLLTRAVPYLNVLEISFTLRVLLGLVAILLFMPLLEPVLGQLYAALADGLRSGLDVLAAR